jgi:hypothetical protein
MAHATIVEELHEMLYGERQYCVDDLEVHHWLFSKQVSDVDLLFRIVLGSSHASHQVLVTATSRTPNLCDRLYVIDYRCLHDPPMIFETRRKALVFSRVVWYFLLP